MIATAPNVTLGRANGARTVFNGAANVIMYFGRWPFDEPAFAGGNVITNEYFSITSRSAGVWNGTTENNTMFAHGTGTGSLTMNVLAGIDVDYPTYLPK